MNIEISLWVCKPTWELIISLTLENQIYLLIYSFKFHSKLHKTCNSFRLWSTIIKLLISSKLIDILHPIIGIAQFQIIILQNTTIIWLQKVNVVIKNFQKKKKQNKMIFRFKLSIKPMSKWRDLFNQMEWRIWLLFI